jgi:hypothetical protein
LFWSVYTLSKVLTFEGKHGKKYTCPEISKQQRKETLVLLERESQLSRIPSDHGLDFEGSRVKDRFGKNLIEHLVHWPITTGTGG